MTKTARIIDGDYDIPGTLFSTNCSLVMIIHNPFYRMDKENTEKNIGNFCFLLEAGGTEGYNNLGTFS